jgi:hypothetical protein
MKDKAYIKAGGNSGFHQKQTTNMKYWEFQSGTYFSTDASHPKNTISDQNPNF